MNTTPDSANGYRRGPGRLTRAAQWHAARGLAVFPLGPGSKKPAVDDWPHAATTDADQITQWWSEAPYNIGVATGPSNLLVIDLDRPRTPDEAAPAPWSSLGVTCGRDVLEQLAADASQRLPRTWTVTTPSGGQHLYFQQPDNTQHGATLGNTAGKLGWKIDTRGDGGYVVAAGSVIRGQRYRADLIRRPQTLPRWIFEALAAQPAPHDQQPTGAEPPYAGQRRLGPAYGLKALEGQLDKLLAATTGQRNDDLNASAYALGRVAAAGALDPQVIRDELLAAALRIGLGRREAERTIESGLSAGLLRPRVAR